MATSIGITVHYDKSALSDVQHQVLTHVGSLRGESAEDAPLGPRASDEFHSPGSPEVFHRSVFFSVLRSLSAEPDGGKSPDYSG
jgi:hypothetical protein